MKGRKYGSERMKQALELAAAGLSYEEIAKSLGLRAKSTVHGLIHRALRAIPAEATVMYRHAEDQRIEALMSVYMPKAMADDRGAAELVIRLMDRRYKLMGISAPERAPVNENGETVGLLDGFDAVAFLASRFDRLAAQRGPASDAGGADA
jgi:hypothetical protein